MRNVKKGENLGIFFDLYGKGVLDAFSTSLIKFLVMLRIIYYIARSGILWKVKRSCKTSVYSNITKKNILTE